MATLYQNKTSSSISFDRYTYVTPEASDHIQKQGPIFRLLREKSAMQCVDCCTSIPVPQILATNILEEDEEDDEEEVWMIIERVRGDRLGEAWPTMNESSRTRTLQELKKYLQQLRNITPYGRGWIGSCSAGPAYDYRLSTTTNFDRFKSVGEFYDFLVQPVKDGRQPELAAEYRRQLPDDSEIVYAHGDVSWENILVDSRSGEVTAIMGWENAGFWPDWWEYRKAVYGARKNQPWWMEIVKEIIPESPREADLDTKLEEYPRVADVDTKMETSYSTL